MAQKDPLRHLMCEKYFDLLKVSKIFKETKMFLIILRVFVCS